MKTGFLISCLLSSLLISTGTIFYGWTSAHKCTVISHARGIAEVVAQSRQVYSEYHNDEDPLPITFARDLANRIETAEINIYSPYPFPSNLEGGLRNEFQRQAWDRLANHGDVEYISWESGTLKYAVADYMAAKCVDCHNSVEGTPKSDWKVGDVRGIIEIRLPY